MPIASVRAYGRLMLELCTKPVTGLANVSQHMYASSILPHARAKVIESALSAGATHVLMIDSDMTYPPDIVARLIRHRRPFVACNATTRRPPIRWVAKTKGGDVMDSNRGRGIEAASVCGLAVALIERRVFEAIPAPRFFFEFTERGWRGEDVWFCDRSTQAGFQPMIDHDASKLIGHVGVTEYGADDVPEAAQ